MSAPSYNYMTDGGKTWVIGGKLKILPNAEVEGMTGGADAEKMEAIPDSAATSVAALRGEFNNLLKALRTAGLMKEE